MTMWNTAPPPPAPLIVVGKHGEKFKVRVFGLTKIMTKEAILKLAAERRAIGAHVELWPFIKEEN